MSINITSLSKIYRTGQTDIAALTPTNLTLGDCSFTTVVGKSGCGKTTLLRLLAGLEEPTSGAVTFDMQAPEIGFVFQEARLMPWLTVAENIAFSARKSNIANANLPYLLKILGLTAFADAYPAELSGGMAQRTALGRTLFQNPDIILMDEPFGALDYFTRKGLQETLLALFQKERKTIIFVTHDVEEAVILGERVLIMQKGNIIDDIVVNLTYPRDPASAALQALRRRILNGLE